MALDSQSIVPTQEIPAMCDESDVLNTVISNNIIDLYLINHPKMTKVKEEKPFEHIVKILEPEGKINKERALVDGGTMVRAMCTLVFNRIQHQMGQLMLSKCLLRIANGAIKRSESKWEGQIRMGTMEIKGQFEVFNSSGSWESLLDKPLLHLFRVLHKFDTDMVTIQDPRTDTATTLHNHTQTL